MAKNKLYHVLATKGNVEWGMDVLPDGTHNRVVAIDGRKYDSIRSSLYSEFKKNLVAQKLNNPGYKHSTRDPYTGFKLNVFLIEGGVVQDHVSQKNSLKSLIFSSESEEGLKTLLQLFDIEDIKR